MIVRARTGKTVRRLRTFGDQHDWAPGGRRLLFANSEDVFVVRADGTGNPRRVVNSGGGLLSAVWSPDGERVAFVRQLPTGEEEVRFGVFTKRIDGGRVRRIYRTSEESSEETLEPLTISWQPVVGPEAASKHRHVRMRPWTLRRITTRTLGNAPHSLRDSCGARLGPRPPRTGRTF